MWKLHITFASLDENATFGVLVRVLKRLFDAVFACSGQTRIPGKHRRDESHSCGWALPRGVILEARPFFTVPELESFAAKLLDGGGRTLKTWDFSLSEYDA